MSKTNILIISVIIGLAVAYVSRFLIWILILSILHCRLWGAQINQVCDNGNAVQTLTYIGYFNVFLVFTAVSYILLIKLKKK